MTRKGWFACGLKTHAELRAVDLLKLFTRRLRAGSIERHWKVA